MAESSLYYTPPERGCVRVLKEHLDSVDFLRINEDLSAPQIASVAHDCTIKFWDLATFRLLKSVRAHENAIYCCDVSASTLCTSSPDTTIALWDFRSYNSIAKGKAHQEKVYYVRFTGPEEVLSCGRDGKLLLWDTRRLSAPKADISAHPDHIYRSADVSADRSLIVAVTQQSQVEVYDYQSRRLLWETLIEWDMSVFPEDADFLTPPSTIYNARFLHRSRDFLTAHQDKAVRRFTTAPAFAQTSTLRNHYNFVRHIEVAEDDSFFVSTCQDGSIRRWEGSEAVLSYTGANQIISSAAITRDKRLLVASCWDQCLYIFEA